MAFVRHSSHLTHSKGVTINFNLRQKDKGTVKRQMGQKRPALQKQTRAKEDNHYKVAGVV
ncbi:hypothetical protein HALA3H3_1060001 [Halomonas sp. A3H3]|nr:hypothetical protein HALA3H3_1060001 [Halomonas sp. A3H3]